MIDLTQPDGQSLIEIEEGFSSEAGEEVTSDGTEEAFDLAFALRFVWPRMHEGNTEACGDVFEMMRAECCAVVGVEFSGQSSGREGRSEGLGRTIPWIRTDRTLREEQAGSDRR